MTDNSFGETIRQHLDAVAAVTGATREEARRAAILAGLAELGGGSVQDDALRFEGTSFILPEQYKGDVDAVVSYLRRYQAQMGTMHEFTKVFRYRPYDVAHAVNLALKEIFGTTGIGEVTTGFFGDTPPQFVTVKTSVDEEIQVPWGAITFPPLGEGATIIAEGSTQKGIGVVGRVCINAPRHQRAVVDGLFRLIEEKLKTHSIYRGKALMRADHWVPEFLDVRRVNPAHVIYSESVLEQLNANVWALIENTDLMREIGESLKRTVLLEGPYGTGKSLAAYLTAQKAEDNGWTFIFVRPGDNLDYALRTAQLYAPAVVFFEDVDVIGEAGDPAQISKLLDSFDGISNKGTEIISILTTNHKDKIHRGMLRPGRLDAMISINSLDEEGIKKLIAANVPDGTVVDVDYAEVYKAFEGFTPAFAKEAISRTKRYAIARTGMAPQILTTSDFAAAAQSMRPQFELMMEAAEHKVRPTVDTAIGDVVKGVINQVKFVDAEGDAAAVYGAAENPVGLSTDAE